MVVKVVNIRHNIQIHYQGIMCRENNTFTGVISLSLGIRALGNDKLKLMKFVKPVVCLFYVLLSTK